ncbi:MAG: hypothetical protein ACLRL4_11035 [Bifidobacterium bifidum]
MSLRLIWLAANSGSVRRHLLFGDGRHPVRFRQWDVIVAQLLHEAVRIPVAMIEIVFDQRGDAGRRLTPGAKGLVACQGQLGVDGEDDMSSYSFDHALFQVVAAVGYGEQRLAYRAFAGVVLPGDDRDPVQRDGGRSTLPTPSMVILMIPSNLIV